MMNPLQTRRVRRVLVAVAALLIAVALVATVVLMEPLPPRTIFMATGAQGGAYAEAGRRYQAILARSGVRLELRESHGSVDNLELLRDPQSGVSVALAQGGLTSATESPDIRSLGTVSTSRSGSSCGERNCRSPAPAVSKAAAPSASRAAARARSPRSCSRRSGRT
jgi:hypothetical protein